MVAAAVTAFPLVGLVAYGAVDRYNVDRGRANTQATNRSVLYATLLDQTGGAAFDPSSATLEGLITLAPLSNGGVLDVFDGKGRLVATSGASRRDPPTTNPRVAAALAHRSGTFKIRGPDGVDRVWGLTAVRYSALTIAYGIPGSVVYGASETALKRDLILALITALAALGAAFLLADRVTAPIRRLAARVGNDPGSLDDIGALARGIDRMDDAIEESRTELALRADRLSQALTERDGALTDLHSSHEQLAERERAASQLAAIVESSGDAIVSETLDGTITSWNAGAERLYRYTAEEIIGQNISVLAPTEAVGQISVSPEPIAGDADDLGRLELQQVTKNGQLLHISVTVAPVHDHNGEITGTATISRDVTRRKLAEDRILHLNEDLEERVGRRTVQLEEANRELESFSYSVSHDLRAPLRAIDGFSRLVIEDYAHELDEEGLRYLGLVCRNTRQMGELIDGLLAFSGLKQQPLDKRPVDVEALAHEVVDSLTTEPDGRASGIEVGVLPEASADPMLLRQVLANLLSNAIKFTRDTEERRIEVGSYQDNGVPVYLVRDNGIGFDMRHAEKLFTVFQRLNRAEDYEGTGIGLALVARIVSRHGGRIWADAKPGEGATFFFTLDGEQAR
jgi:PAS domain S-box-containing protein